MKIPFGPNQAIIRTTVSKTPNERIINLLLVRGDDVTDEQWHDTRAMFLAAKVQLRGDGQPPLFPRDESSSSTKNVSRDVKFRDDVLKAEGTEKLALVFESAIDPKRVTAQFEFADLVIP